MMPHHSLKVAKSHAKTEGKRPSCGCMKYIGFREYEDKTKANLIGQRFENLIVLAEAEVILTGRDCKKRRTWKCLCDCGNITCVTTGDLQSGNTKSCGCLKSLGQKRITEYLQKRKITFIPEYSFLDLKTERNHPLRFDFAIMAKEKLLCLIEYQGQQHFDKRDVWFGKQQREVTDKQKRLYCKEHHLLLFEIAFDEDIEQRMDSIMQYIHGDTVPSAA